jgi:hypothetical protein
MQTNNRLIYCKGGSGSFVKARELGGILGSLAGVAQDGVAGAADGAGLAGAWDGIKGGTSLGGVAGAAGGALGSLLAGGPKQDPIAGGVEKGLDSSEMNEISNAGKGVGVAAGITGGLGKVAEKIPGLPGVIASGALGVASKFLAGKQQQEQQAKMTMLADAKEDRDTDFNTMNSLAAMGQKGGVLYKKPDRVLSLVSGGGMFKVGGKAPELKWNHTFKLNLPESTMEKKKAPIKIFKRGGKFDNPDKTNVIVTGSRHHEDNGLGDKGVPVIDKTGEKVFEVEKGELILTKEATDTIESLLSKYKKVEVDEDKAHDVLKNLGSFFKDEIKENLHNYEENAV